MTREEQLMEGMRIPGEDLGGYAMSSAYDAYADGYTAGVWRTVRFVPEYYSSNTVQHNKWLEGYDDGANVPRRTQAALRSQKEVK